MLCFFLCIVLLESCKKKEVPVTTVPESPKSNVPHDYSGTYHTYEGSTMVMHNTTVVSDDGNIILCASKDNGHVTSVIKISPLGTLMWRKNFSLNDNYFSYFKITKTSDGGSFILGPSSYYNFPNQKDFLLVKINTTGDTAFSRLYGNPGDDVGLNIISTADGNYLLEGAFGSSSWDVHLIKVDINGNMIWQKSLFANENRSIWSLIETNDGGFLITGNKDSVNPHTNPFIVKTDANGNVLWEKRLGNSFPMTAIFTLQLQNGDFLTSCMAFVNSDTKLVLLKYDNNGSFIWTHTYQDDVASISLSKLIQAADGNILIAGHCFYSNQNQDIYLAKINTDGDLLWQKACGGGSEVEYVSDALTGPNGDIYITGNKYPVNNGFSNKKVFMLVSDQDGNLK